MSGETVQSVPEDARSEREERVVAHLVGRRPGPLVVVVGGLHGNEPAGTIAGTNLAALLAPLEEDLGGELLILRGNLAALRNQSRFLEVDLNRAWTDASVDLVRSGTTRFAEEREMQGLLAAIDPLVTEGREVIVIDLHTTSAPGAPFLVLWGEAECSTLLEGIEMPRILGLDTLVSGSLGAWCGRRGRDSVVCEGGQHTDPASVVFHEAVLLSVLEQSGQLPTALSGKAAVARKRIADRCRGLPRAIQVVHRQDRAPGDGFRMARTFQQFERVRKGQVLAFTAQGEVCAERDGILMLPTYQKQGDDGFFLGVELE